MAFQIPSYWPIGNGTHILTKRLDKKALSLFVVPLLAGHKFIVESIEATAVMNIAYVCFRWNRP